MVAIKRTPDGNRALVVDGGVNLLYTSNWYKLNVKPAKESAGSTSNATLFGPLCMNIDVIRKQVALPQVDVGDKLVIYPVGAYNVTQSMQFIFYRPNVVLVGVQGETDIIRQAENLDYVEQMERMPERLLEK